MSEIHDKVKREITESIKALSKLVDDDEESLICKVVDDIDGEGNMFHNSIWCNMQDSIDNLENCLKVFEWSHWEVNIPHTQINMDTLWNTAILLLHKISQELFYALEAAGLNLLCIEKDFTSIFRIKYLANFLKHPKTKMLIHHPEFDYLDPVVKFKDQGSKTGANKFISEDKIHKFYKNRSHDQSFEKEFANKEEVIIVLPSISELIEGTVNDIKKSLETYENNPLIKANLKSKSMLERGNVYEIMDMHDQMEFDRLRGK